ncbi:MAG: 3-hydroxyacyl-CoA dehydrogenase [Gammaproteobacteria bacterium]
MAALDSSVTVGVVGAGTMGAGIAEVAANAGHPVLLYDTREGAAPEAISKIADRLARSVEKGRIDAGRREAILKSLQAVDSLEALAPCGLVIEAIVEDLKIKQTLFSGLEGIVGPDAILATNTSSISVTAIGAALDNPGRLVGMHFFNPATLMKLVEVVHGLASDPAVVDTVFATSEAWGKKTVKVSSTPGFIVNRVARPFYAEALRALGEGAADVATIDAILRESGGFRMGPFELMDLIGHDVNSAVTQTVFNAFHQDPRFEPSLIQQELVAAGRLGRKTGRGFYVHDGSEEAAQPATAEAAPAPSRITAYGHLEVLQPLVEMAEEAGIAVDREEADFPGPGWLRVGDANVAMSDGRSATERSRQGLENLVLIDLALDYRGATRLAVAPSDHCDEAALASVVGFIQALGKSVSVIDDYPGMLVLRTVCMLANLGADAVHKGVCSAGAVDTAMRYGVNYPEGPLAWAEAIGLARVVEVLDHVARTYGEARYRVSPLLRRKVWSEAGFFDS